ncbi:nuclear pore protein 84/107 [Polychytrium aggregatum]|uniref:nuclear pore protein 84/107 n=1 Tax=Polychytrium aggregatum TaxID=110093 RepID=UPI0022FEC5ED|nr:nuclear pore protein 84/107 [Polychytrium aggregatum]KAI9193582.1 nuclear pore protein 84/107 [Polychytrium aggregatum]
MYTPGDAFGSEPQTPIPAATPRSSFPTPSFRTSRIDQTKTEIVPTDATYDGPWSFGYDYDRFAALLAADPKETTDYRETELIPRYIELCTKMIDDLESREASASRDEIEMWALERNSWHLIQDLVSYRLEDPKSKLPFHPFESDSQIVSESIASNPEVAELSRILAWLEKIAPPFQPVEKRPGYWPMTKKRSTKYTFDPDLTSRERGALAPEDDEFDRKLSETVFQYCRRGRYQELVQLCQGCDQAWRAALLQGSEFSAHHGIDGGAELGFGGEAEIGGNVNRDLWKAVCYEMARNTSDRYERALLAAVIGDVNMTIPVCESWEDHVWAYIRALLEAKCDEALAQIPQIPGIYDDQLPMFVPHFSGTLEKVLIDMTRSDITALSTSARHPMRMFQSFLMLNRMTEFLDGICSYIQAPTAENRIKNFPQYLRFVVHMILICRDVEYPIPAAASNNVIRHFVKLLIDGNKRPLVPLYTSYLPRDQQIQMYSLFLAGIDDSSEERYKYWKIGFEYSLDMMSIGYKVVECIFVKGIFSERLPPSSLEVKVTQINDSLSKLDRSQIYALEWLSFQREQQEQLLYGVSFLIRRFLVHGRVHAARQTFDHVVADWVKELRAQLEDSMKDSPEIKARIRSIECLTSELNFYFEFLEAVKAYTKWSILLMKRPRQSKTIDGLNRVSAGDQANLAQWQIQMMNESKGAIDALERVVRSNWLQVLLEDDTAGDEQKAEYQLLRCVYLPELVIWLQQIYYETRDLIPGNLERSISIVQEVTSQPMESEFQESKKLPVLLSKVRKAAIESLLRTGKDGDDNGFAWGSKLSQGKKLVASKY